MARGVRSSAHFFGATLVLWTVSVAFEVVFNRRVELIVVPMGFAFFQIANCVVRGFISKDPLFVNTAVSLIHSTITSVSVLQRQN